MKKQDVTLGAVYLAKVSGKLTEVRIDSESTHGGWNGTNLLTGRTVRIKSAQRLRREVERRMKPGDERFIDDIPFEVVPPLRLGDYELGASVQARQRESILKRARRAAKQAGWTDERWRTVEAEATAVDYENFRRVMARHFSIKENNR